MKPKSRLSRHRRWNFDILEDRLTPTQAPWSVYLQSIGDLIVDDTRHLLYITTGAGTVERYDWVNHQFLTPINVGGHLAGGDITPDSNTLVVADQTPQGNLSVVHKINLIDQTVTDIAFAREHFYQSDYGGSYDVAILSNQTAWITVNGDSFVTLKTLDLTTNTVDVYHDVNNNPVSLYRYSPLERSANRESVSIRNYFSSMWLAHPADNVITEYPIPGNYGGSSGYAPSWSPDGELFTMQAKDHFVSINHADGSPDHLIAAGAALYTPDGKYFLRYHDDSYSPEFIAENRQTGTDDWSLPVDDSDPRFISRPNSSYGSIGKFSSDSHFLFTSWGNGFRIYELPEANEHGVATHFEVTSSLPVVTINKPTTFQVTARDYFGRIDTDYTGTISVGIYGDATIDQPEYTFQPGDHGTHRFDITYQATLELPSIIEAHQQDDFAIRGSTNVSILDPQILWYTVQPYISNTLHDPLRNQFFAISDNRILQFDMNQHRLLNWWEVGASPTSMALSPDGQTLYVTEGVVQLHAMSLYSIQLQTGAITRLDAVPTAEESRFDSIAATSDGKFLLTTQNANDERIFQLHVFDPQTSTINPFQGASGSAQIDSLSYLIASANGEHVLFVLSDGRYSWYDVATGLVTEPIDLDSLGLYSSPVSLSSNGQWFSAGRNDGHGLFESVVLDRQGHILQTFDNGYIQFDTELDRAYVYSGANSYERPVSVYETQHWAKVFEYYFISTDPDPTGGFTRHILDRNSSYPSGIPVPPVDQTWVSAGSTSVMEGDTNKVYLQFPVRLSRASSVPVSVQYATGDYGDVQPGYDYVPISGTLTFAPGETLKYVKVAIPGNIAPQFTRTIYLSLSHATNAFLASTFANGDIQDNDEIVFVHFDAFQSYGPESKANINLHLTLDHAVSVPVSVSYHLEHYDSYDDSVVSATLGKDVTGISGKVTFLPGQTIANFPIKIINDSIDEFNEIFYIALDQAEGGISLTNDTATTYTIIDDDAPPVVSWTTRQIIAREGGNTPYYLDANLSSPSEKPVSVEIGARGAATLGNDFYTLPFYFAPGKTNNKRSLTIVDDTTYEKGENAILNLINAQNATIKRGQVALLSILDNDPPPRFIFLGNEADLYRTGANYELYVYMGRETQVRYKVEAVVLPGSTAIEGIDYVWSKRTMQGIAGGNYDYLSLLVLPQPTGTPPRILKLGLRAIFGATIDRSSEITIQLIDYPGF